MNVRKLFDLTGKVALVTGGAGHLGSAISEGLAEAGAAVYIASRNEPKCQALAQAIGERTGAKATGLTLDIASMDSVRHCVRRVAEEAGRIDVLVNNAVFVAGGRLEDMSEENWLKGIDGGLHSVFRCMQAVIPIMEAGGSGSIINNSSMYGIVSPDPSIYGDSGQNNPPNYGAAKAAVIQLTRYAACHLAHKGIRVNAFSPGPFPKPQTQQMKWFMANLERKNPMGRIGQPCELKGVVVFLASDASSYVTGVNIPVDGGWTAW